MTEDAGLELLKAVEALHNEVRELRKEVREDREVREQLESRRRADAERSARYRSRHVTQRDNNVTLESLKLDQARSGQIQKPSALRDNHVVRNVTQTKASWEAYSAAFKVRHGAEPVRNATVNSQMMRFVKRVGETEAPGIAEFYVGHNGSRYVAAMHPIGLLLHDAEKLRTEWATGRTVTTTAAKQADQTQANVDGWMKLAKGGANDVG